ncbi:MULTISPECIES: hypothetical protein [Actinoalloteichus]|uniref:SCO6045-like C-terminal domain-containing protein n=1 Tax=Actinoalloteichus caeruleus DSM 43889 TaxID=1120930 RepID=A0ABT1JG89_ACTCY|nr:hypothetical protein [Actinoalloteichus caeruleus]MCP2331507.1 hypothetical protein [Actinoalloteichus caeruleus DSM 43889]
MTADPGQRREAGRALPSDPPTPEEPLTARRAELAARQRALVAALLGTGPVPPGFPPDRIAAQARALVAKRTRVAGRLRPDLVAALGDAFADLFARYAEDHPREVGVGAREDTRRFHRWLVREGAVPRRWTLSRLLRRHR